MYEEIVAYFQQYSGSYAMSVLQHLKISGLAVLVAMLIGIPLGVYSSYHSKLYNLFSTFFGLLSVIPSLAVLFICIPIFGVGVLPATIALTFLAIPPILINTAVGFKNIPDSVLETAVGMGMSGTHTFFKIRVPLSMPMVLTGVRTAAVEVIASATLASYIGAGGLGDLIFTGLGLYRMDLLFIGGFSVAALSLLVDLILSLVERSITAYRRA
jgi:ABC-type proline/glycine betaine transport systems, permease component